MGRFGRETLSSRHSPWKRNILRALAMCLSCLVCRAHTFLQPVKRTANQRYVTLQRDSYQRSLQIVSHTVRQSRHEMCFPFVLSIGSREIYTCTPLIGYLSVASVRARAHTRLTHVREANKSARFPENPPSPLGNGSIVPSDDVLCLEFQFNTRYII